MAVHKRNRDGDFDVTFTGAVVEVYTRTVQVMSDEWDIGTYAMVEDPAGSGDFVEKFVGYGGDGDFAGVDADDDVMARYATFKARTVAKRRDDDAKRHAERAADEAAARARTVGRGDFVEVFKGRKVPKGTVGRVIKTGISRYGEWVLMAVPGGGTEITSIGNVRKLALPPEGTRRTLDADREAYLASRALARGNEITVTVA